MGPTYGWVFRGPQFWHHGDRADQALIKNVGIIFKADGTKSAESNAKAS